MRDEKKVAAIMAAQEAAKVSPTVVELGALSVLGKETMATPYGCPKGGWSGSISGRS